MDDKKVPKDSDPSGMTDFEENATQHEAGEALAINESNRERRDQLNADPDDSPTNKKAATPP